jgi:hypothetical protein
MLVQERYRRSRTYLVQCHLKMNSPNSQNLTNLRAYLWDTVPSTPPALILIIIWRRALGSADGFLMGTKFQAIESKELNQPENYEYRKR